MARVDQIWEEGGRGVNELRELREWCNIQNNHGQRDDVTLGDSST